MAMSRKRAKQENPKEWGFVVNIYAQCTIVGRACTKQDEMPKE
jgi:hypothetical protein